MEALQTKLDDIVHKCTVKEESLLRSSVKTLEFSLEHMCFLRTLGMTWTRISAIFGVSRMTLYLKRRDSGILDDFKYSIISDSELEKKIQEIKLQMPDIGEKMITGVLRSNGISVQRHRIRKALHSVDPKKQCYAGTTKLNVVLTVFQDQCHYVI